MKNLKSFMFVRICFVAGMFMATSLSGQEVISSSGDFHSAGGHSVSWTIGEPVIDTWTAGGTVISQGFQQPILDIVSVYEHPELSFDINAYPNPTSDFLNIVVTNGDYEKLSYHLFDINGKLLDSKQIISETTEIMFTQFPAAMYYLRIMHSNSEMKTFKIVKNQ
jgi:hypothetical protein